MKKIIRLIIWIITLLALLLVLFYFTNLKKNNDYYSNAAYLQSDQVSVNSPLEGKVNKIYVTENTIVTKGQPLVIFDDSDYKNQLQVAQLNLEEINNSIKKFIVIKNYEENQLKSGIEKKKISDAISESTKKLYELISNSPNEYISSIKKLNYLNSVRSMNLKNMDQTSLLATLNKNLIITKHEINDLVTKSKKQKIIIEITSKLISTKTIKSPIEGQVRLINVSPGQYVPPYTILAIILNKKVNSVKALFNEKDIPNIHIGDTAKILIKDFLDKPLSATVSSTSLSSYSDAQGSPFTFLNGNINHPNNLFLVTLTLSPPPSLAGKLRSGMSAIVTIHSKQ